MNVIRACLIEDNSIFCFLFKTYMEEFPLTKIELQIFSDGIQALEYFKLNKHEPTKLPEIIFLDLNMPFITGWELLDKLIIGNYNFINEIPVIIVSSSKNPFDIDKSKQYSCIQDYIVKPIDRNSIHTLLKKHINE